MTNWKKALNTVVSRTSYMQELRSPVRRGEDAVACSGHSALIVYGRADLCDDVKASEQITQRLGPMLWEPVDTVLAELRREELPAFDPDRPCCVCSGRGSITCEECGGKGRCKNCDCGDCPDCEGTGEYPCERCKGSGKQDPRRPEPVPGLVRVPGSRSIVVDLARLELETRELPPATGAAVLLDTAVGGVLLLRGTGWAYILCRTGMEPTREITLEPRLRDGKAHA